MRMENRIVQMKTVSDTTVKLAEFEVKRGFIGKSFQKIHKAITVLPKQGYQL